MLLLIRMLSELLDKTGLTFPELVRLLGRLGSLLLPCPEPGTEAFRTWLRALIETFLAESPVGQDKELAAWARSLTVERWAGLCQLWSVLEAGDELPAPDSVDVQRIVVGMVGDGVDAGRGAMLCYTLAAWERIMRK